MTGFLELFIIGLMEGGLYALVGASIVLVFKATKIVSLAHGQLLAFGALFFSMFLGPLGLSLVIAVPLTFVVTGAIGLLIDRIALRPLIGQPLFAAFLVTFAIFIVLDGILQMILKGSTKALPPFLPDGTIHISGVEVSEGQLISFVAVLVFFGLLGLLFQYTKIGLGMQATSEDHQLAQSTGVAVKRIFSVVWVLSAIVASVAGIAVANVTDIHYSLPYIGIKGLIVAIFGGLESLVGVLLGGLILGVLENVSAGYLDPYVGGGVKEVAAYVVLLTFLLVKPYGLFGQVRIERI